MFFGLGAQLSLVDYYGRTPLDYALISGEMEYSKQVLIVRKLVQNGAIIGNGKSDGRSGIEFACAMGKEGLVKELMRLNVQINRFDKSGKTPLHYAALFGRTA